MKTLHAFAQPLRQRYPRAYRKWLKYGAFRYDLARVFCASAVTVALAWLVLWLIAHRL
jgi:hypothetical protein